VVSPNDEDSAAFPRILNTFVKGEHVGISTTPGINGAVAHQVSRENYDIRGTAIKQFLEAAPGRHV
jgi:hypothetical protein